MPTTPAWISDGSPIEDTFGDGERAVQWLRKLRHPKNRDRGNAFQLAPFQERIVRKIYGPRHKADDPANGIRKGDRFVTTALLALPRGNRKTALMAAITLLHLRGPERVPGALIQSAASARKQARECFEEVALIVNFDPRLRGGAKPMRIQDTKNRIVYPAERTRYEAISADAGVQHGSTPQVVIADELHAWKRRDLWDVLESAANKSPDTLTIIATTAGSGTDNVCFEKVAYGRKVQSGEVVDPSFLPVIFEATNDDDWRSEHVWRAVNPGWDLGYLNIPRLRQMAARAEHMLGDRAAFRQLHLNIWQEYSSAPFVTMDVFDACESKVEIDFDQLEHDEVPCWIGVDLSHVSDLTVIVVAWRLPDHEDAEGRTITGDIIVRPWFYCPRDLLPERSTKSGTPYLDWSKAGHIEATEGNSVDYSAVSQKIKDLCATFNVREVLFDPWSAKEMQQGLMAEGITVASHRQGYQSMSPAIFELERALVAQRLCHDGNPILRWNFENIAISTDPAGNRKFDKTKARDKIDGAIAAAMAVSRAVANDNQPDPFWTDPDFMKNAYGAA